MSVSSVLLSPTLYVQSTPTAPVSIATALASLSTSRSGTVQIQDTAENIALNLDALQKVNSRISSLSFSGNTSTLAITAKQVTADASVLTKLGTYSLAVQSALVADVSKLSSNSKVTSIAVADSSKNIGANFDQLSAATKVSTITQTGTAAPIELTSAQLLTPAKAATLDKVVNSYTLKVTGVSTTDMSTIAANAKVSAIHVTDSSAEIAAHLDELQLLGVRLVSAKATDKEALSVTSTQVKTDALVLGKIYGGYELAVHGAAFADVVDLAKNKKIKTIDVIDSSANVVQNLAALKKLGTHLTSVTLTDADTPVSISYDQFTKNTAVLSKITNSAATYAVTQVSYANVSALTANTQVSTVAVADTALNISAHLNDLLALDTKLASVTRTGAATPLSMTATQLVDDAAVLEKMQNSYTVSVSGVTAANAAALAQLSAVASFNISDTSANIAAQWDALNSLGPKLKQITQTGTATTMAISATQLSQSAATLAKISGAYSLAVSDVTADNATSIAAQTNVASLAVLDSSANISAKLDALNAVGTKLTSIAQTEPSVPVVVTASQLVADSATLGKISTDYSLTVSQVFASDATATAGVDRVASISVSDTSANIALNLDALQALGDKLTRVTQRGTPAAMSITVDQLASDAEALGKLSNSFSLAVSGVAVADASRVASTAHVTSLDVADTSANIAANLDALKALGKELHAITQSSVTPMNVSADAWRDNADVLQKISNGFSLAVSGVTAGNAASVAAQRNVASIAVSDTSANIAAKLDVLAQLSTRLASIEQTGTKAALTLTADQYAADQAIFDKIDAGDYTLSVNHVRASQVATLVADTHVTDVMVADTAINLVANLPALKAALTVSENGADVDKLKGIQQTGSGPLAITQTQLQANDGVLAKFVSNYNLSVRDVTAATATSVAAMDRVVSVAVADSSANIATHMDALNALGKELTTITQTGTAAALSLSASQLLADKSALAKITNNYTLSMRDVTADTAASVAANGHVVSMDVTDTTANITRKLDTLQNVSTKINTITQSDADAALQITAHQFSVDSVALSKVVGDYDLNVRDVAAAQATDVAHDAHVASYSVADTSVNLAKNLDALFAVKDTLDHIDVTGPVAPLTITASQLTDDAAVLSKISNNYNLAITDVLVANATSVATQSHVATVAVADSSAHVAEGLDTLQSLGAKLSGITQTGTAQALSISAQEYIADQGALSKIQDSYTLAVDSVHADDATAFGADGHVVALNVVDSTANIQRNIDGLQRLGTQLVDVTQTDADASLVITEAQWHTDNAALAKIQGDYVLTVRDVSAESATSMANQSHVTSVRVADTAANVTQHLDELHALGDELAGLSLVGQAQALAMTATQWTTDADVLDKISTAYTVNVSDMAAQDAAALAANAHVSAVSVLDTSEHIAAQLDGLQALGKKLSDIDQSGTAAPLTITAQQLVSDAAAIAKLADIYTLHVTDVTAANASRVAAQNNVSSVDVADSAANLNKNLDVLTQLGAKLTSITQTGAAANWVITASQLTASAATFDKIQGDFSLDVRDVMASQAASVSAQDHVVALKIKDSAENVGANWSALASTDEITSISATGSAPIAINATQWADGASTLAKISGSYSMTVSDVAAADAASIATGHVASVSVADSSANIQTNLDALQGLGSRLTHISQTTASTMTLTADALYANAATLAKIADSYTLNVSDVAAADAATVSEITGLVSMSVSDTSANLSTYLDDLQELGATVNQITTSNASTALQITAEQWARDAATLGKIDTYSVSVSGVALQDLAGVQADAHVQHIAVADTSANVSRYFDDLVALGDRLDSVTQVDTVDALTISATQLAQGATVLNKLSNAYTLAVSDVTAANAAAVGAQAHVTSLTVADSSAHLALHVNDLQALGDTLSAITQTGTPQEISVSATDWAATSSIWGKFTNSVTVAVSDVAAQDAVATANQDYVSHVSVSDTRANVAAHWDELVSLSNPLTAVTLSGAEAAIGITQSQMAAGSALFDKLSGTYTLALSEVNADDAATLASDARVASLDVADTTTNVANFMDQLNGLDKLTHIALTDSSTLELTTDQIAADTSAIAKLDSAFSVVEITA